MSSKTALLIPALIACLSMKCQKVLVNSVGPGYVFKGIENNLSVFVEGYRCKDISILPHKGKIRKFGCDYAFSLDSLGEVKFDIFVVQKNKRRKVAERYLAVVNIPPPVATLGGLNGGELSVKMLSVQQGIGAQADLRIRLDLYYRVARFNFIVTRQGKICLWTLNDGNFFSENTRSLFKDLQADDNVIIANIVCDTPDGKQVTRQPLQFHITN